MNEKENFPYDVFVSYRWVDPDQLWVREQLVPALKRAGLKVCLDVEDFIPGRDLILEMNRAGSESRRAICVLSPDYFEGNRMVGFESLMARRTDPSGKESRLIPLVLRDTHLPEWIRGLIPIDWTNPDHHLREWRKLLKVLDAHNLDSPPPGFVDNSIPEKIAEPTRNDSAKQLLPRELESSFLLDACYWLARISTRTGLLNRYNKVLSSSLRKLARIEPNAPYTWNAHETASKSEARLRNADNPFNRINYSYPVGTMDSYIPYEIHHIRGSIGSYQDLLDIFVSEQKYQWIYQDEHKKIYPSVYYETYCLMISKSVYFYDNFLNQQEDLQSYVEFINSETGAEQRYKELGFESHTKFWEYVCPTVASINKSLEETTLLLYHKALESGNLDANEAFSEGFTYWNWVEVVNALIGSKWAEYDEFPVKLHLNGVGKVLLKRRLDAIM